jgi:alpha-D-xyloside xylohydrolase
MPLLTPTLRMLVLAGALTSLTAADWTVTKTADGLEASKGGERVAITMRADDIVRIRRSVRPAWIKTPSIAVVPTTDGKPQATVATGNGAAEVKTPAMRVRFDTNSGEIMVADANGRILLTEGGHSVAAATCGKDNKEEVQKVAQSWRLAEGESLYGMGSVQDDNLDLRVRLKRELLIKVDNIIDPMPCWVSTAGYGLLWDSPAVAKAKVADNQLSISTDLADEEDYYVVAAPRLADAVRGFHRLTGSAPMPPRWAFGYIQSKERYLSQAETTDVAKRLRADHFPVDAVVQDWQYWGKYGWNAMRFDPKTFPDPKGFGKTLSDMHVQLVLSVWSNFPGKSPMGEALKGKLLDDKEVWGKAFLYDSWSPEARAIVWNQVQKELLPIGVGCWWTDHTDFMGYQDGNGTTVRGNVQRVFNSYCMGANQTYWDGQRKALPDKRVFSLTRSAYPGLQRYGAFFWNGDIRSNWDELRKQQACALNTSLSGISYWNADIGGFFARGGADKDPGYRELYTRWFQCGAFTAMFRSHGTGAPREPWVMGQAGEPVYDTLVKFATLRYRMLPYIYSQAWGVTSNSDTLMRALPMEFPADTNVRNLAGQWMFGPSIMVTPITAPTSKETQKEVVFPEGARWYDFWTGVASEGGGSTTFATDDITTMPLHVRAGSIIPLGPELQYTSEKPADPLEIRVYPGANASFTLYEDAGDGYGYEKGERATITFTWDDAKQKLAIDKRDGSFPGMLTKRTFRVVRVRDGIGGITPIAKVDAEVAYTGEATAVTLKP